MECTHGTRMTLKCPQCESLKREQQYLRFSAVDCDPGDCDLEPRRAAWDAAIERYVTMSADAGSIGETRTERRIQYEICSERTKQAIYDELREYLPNKYKWGHDTLEEVVDRVKAIVLDTVAA